MSIKFLIILPLFLAFLVCSSQEYPNQAYYTALIRELESNPKIEEVKFVQKKTFGGKLKRQCVFVRYKDSTNYWQVGKEYCFYNNGNIKYIHKYNIANHIQYDTLICLNKKGDFQIRYLYDNNFVGAELFSKTVDFESLNGRSYYFKQLTSSYIEQYFSYNKIFFEGIRVYNRDEGRWRYHKKVYYNEDGSIKEEIVYDEVSDSGAKEKSD